MRPSPGTSRPKATSVSVAITSALALALAASDALTCSHAVLKALAANAEVEPGLDQLVAVGERDGIRERQYSRARRLPGGSPSTSSTTWPHRCTPASPSMEGRPLRPRPTARRPPALGLGVDVPARPQGFSFRVPGRRLTGLSRQLHGRDHSREIGLDCQSCAARAVRARAEAHRAPEAATRAQVEQARQLDLEVGGIVALHRPAHHADPVRARVPDPGGAARLGHRAATPSNRGDGAKSCRGVGVAPASAARGLMPSAPKVHYSVSQASPRRPAVRPHASPRAARSRHDWRGEARSYGGRDGRAPR